MAFSYHEDLTNSRFVQAPSVSAEIISHCMWLYYRFSLSSRDVVLPPRSSNLHADAERWVRSVKDEALSRMILCGENSLWPVLNEYVDHYHQERHHQGKGHGLLFPRPRLAGEYDGLMQCRERLGGLLKYYEREAA